MKGKFVLGDKVFAKVRGYPYWPAKIVGVQDDTSKVKYDIVFYGSAEKAVVKEDDVQPFAEKRQELGKPKKQKAFNDAMSAIDNDLDPELAAKAELEDQTPKKRVSTKRQSEMSEAASTERPVRGRKRKAMDESVEETPETTRVGRRIKTKRLSVDTPSVSPKKKSLDKLQDYYEFDVSNEKITINLDTYRPSLKCPKSVIDWNRLVLDKANEFKDKVAQGDLLVDHFQLEMNEFLRYAAKEKKKEYADNEREYKLLKIEGKLLHLDVKVKTALSLNKANPKEALKHLDELLNLPVSAVMLKKHPEIVDTYKRMSRYIGNTSAWSMTDLEKNDFAVSAESVRTRATQVLDKFKELFGVGEDQSFSMVFATQLREFSRRVQSMSQDDFFSLVDDPVASD